jgi:protease I
MIVPPARFKDDEYSRPRGMLDRQGAHVKVACAVNKLVFGLGQTRVKPDMTLEEVDVTQYDAFYIVGGIGVKDLYDHPHALRIVQEAAAHNKIICAIDMGPTLLGKAGILQGKKATEYFSESKALAAMGVDYTGANVQQDGNIYTGKSAESSEKLAFALICALQAMA